MKLILASSSPRRRQLLTDAGYRFSVVPPNPEVENVDLGGLSIAEWVAALAFRKARHVAKQTGQGLVLAADTVAECQGKILGKPRDRKHARDMLMTMRGRLHRVHTGICLWECPGDRQVIRTATTDLKMDPLEDEWIEQYLDTDAWGGKAGAFGFQDGLDWVHIVHGSPSNVVGLPMELLGEMLAAFEARQ